MKLLQDLLQDESEFAEQNLEMYHKAYAEFVNRKMQGVMNIAFENEDMNPLCTNIKIERDVQTRTRAKNMGVLFLFLTISPDQKKISLENFVQKLHQVANRKMVKSFHYVIEQRSDTTDFHGWHTHMLLERSIAYRQDKFIRNLKNSFKNCLDVDNFQLFNFHYICDEFYDDKILYMKKGGKTGEGKDKKQDMDVLFRQKYNLQVYYSNK